MIMKNQKEMTDRWASDINNPLVSISCITFNQEQYIQQAIEGFLIQETSFPFEILIHDDASTDNTAAIIKEYEKKYPAIIKPIYQSENQYSQGNDVSEINIKRAKGKYIAFCEGDDFWIDPLKLQKQIDVLEKNENTFSYTDFYTVDQEGKRIKRFDHDYLRLLSKSGFILHNLLEKNFIMTLSFICRKDVLNLELYKNAPNKLDYILFLTSAYFGKGAYLRDKTCCYRKVNSSLTNVASKKIIGMLNEDFFYFTKVFLNGKLEISPIQRVLIYNSIVVKAIDLLIKKQSTRYIFSILHEHKKMLLFVPSALMKELLKLAKYHLYKKMSK